MNPYEPPQTKPERKNPAQNKMSLSFLMFWFFIFSTLLAAMVDRTCDYIQAYTDTRMFRYQVIALLFCVATGWVLGTWYRIFKDLWRKLS